MGDNVSNPHHKSKAKGDISYSANMAVWWLGRSGAGRYIVTRERLRSPCSEPLPQGRALGTTYREWLSIVAGPAWCSHILPLRVWSAGALVRRGGKAIESTYEKNCCCSTASLSYGSLCGSRVHYGRWPYTDLGVKEKMTLWGRN